MSQYFPRALYLLSEDTLENDFSVINYAFYFLRSVLLISIPGSFAEDPTLSVIRGSLLPLINFRHSKTPLLCYFSCFYVCIAYSVLLYWLRKETALLCYLSHLGSISLSWLCVSCCILNLSDSLWSHVYADKQCDTRKVHLYSETVHAEDLTLTLNAFQEALPQSGCTDLMCSQNITSGYLCPHTVIFMQSKPQLSKWDKEGDFKAHSWFELKWWCRWWCCHWFKCVTFGDGLTFKKCLNYLSRSYFCSYWTVAMTTAHQPNTIRHGLANTAVRFRNRFL